MFMRSRETCQASRILDSSPCWRYWIP